MKKETAVSMLSAMPNKVKGPILEAMEPKKAADLMQAQLNQ
ncbi:hypothetical protein P5G51_011200 [Virgibacillus sp. 179-BFC.A HS]|uniref:Magnesium transporter MgtE intracellular domain-containing protein n=1 Tax=Tigheibacillus jepli TaxID=3035914 RepID=A0ABU5CHQ1_9BACI|nr:hypothetical protein [Virgibacillus sp. 179-BFC.A HS]MDY0405883.1 hypothetical protein [Virgibacillus sp. 179-BFC.A HS]